MRVIFATSILCKFTFSRMYSYRTCNVPINIIMRLKNIAIIKYAFVINVRLIAIFFIYLISLFPFTLIFTLKCRNLNIGQNTIKKFAFPQKIRFPEIIEASNI